MRTAATDVFQYEELSPTAQEKAREWYRQGSQDDLFWSENITDDAKTWLGCFGYDIDKIYWSGFWSQGDGACFEGDFNSDNMNKEKLLLFTSDEEIIKYFDRLQQLCVGNTLTASIKHYGRYYHSGSTRFETEMVNDEGENIEFDEDEFIQVSRGLMDTVYAQFEKAYEWANADEQVIENIMCNDYEFTADGKVW